MADLFLCFILSLTDGIYSINSETSIANIWSQNELLNKSNRVMLNIWWPILYRPPYHIHPTLCSDVSTQLSGCTHEPLHKKCILVGSANTAPLIYAFSSLHRVGRIRYICFLQQAKKKVCLPKQGNKKWGRSVGRLLFLFFLFSFLEFSIPLDTILCSSVSVHWHHSIFHSLAHYLCGSTRGGTSIAWYKSQHPTKIAREN